MVRTVLFLLGALAAFAQPFSAGVKAGVPLTEFLSTVNNVSSTVPNRYIIGGTVELHLPLRLPWRWTRFTAT